VRLVMGKARAQTMRGSDSTETNADERCNDSLADSSTIEPGVLRVWNSQKERTAWLQAQSYCCSKAHMS
jgi:hypothetical protein